MSDDGKAQAGDSIIEACEQALIGPRRARWGDSREGPLLGLALSGGGIRSATFSLGVLRELSALGKLTRFDYLATVSGGSYVGAFLGGLFVPRRGADAVIRAQTPPTGATPDPLGSAEAHESIRLLRQSGRYLAPSGTVDYWYAMAILVRNWIGLHLVLGSIVFGMALVGVWLRAICRYGNGSDAMLHASPFLVLAIVAVAIATAFGWAYWLTRRDMGSGFGNAGGAVAASLLIVAICIRGPEHVGSAGDGTASWGGDAISVQRAARGFADLPPSWSIAAIGIVALAIWLIGLARTMMRGGTTDIEQAWDAQRLWITRRQSLLLQVALAFGAFALADAAAFTLAGLISRQYAWTLGVSPLLAAGLVPMARTLLSRTGSLGTFATGVLGRLASRFLVPGTAAMLVLLVIAFWGTLAYRLTWPFDAPDDGVFHPRLDGLSFGNVVGLANLGDARPLMIATIVVLIVALGIRRTVSFLNLSSLATFYAGRLRRAYLGAGNRVRFGAGIAIEVGDAGDDIDLTDYFPPTTSGAPLHLISVTLNQTRGQGSNIVQHDRHGRNMTLGPAGISVSLDDGTRSHIGHDADTADIERLPLSAWIGISGASFSTGIGARTGFGLTTLAGFANVRLGYWWRAGARRTDKSVQAYLLDEIRGRFAGTGTRRWYLSDGGHFDNSAVYELIRRRLPFILASDNGQDERYGFEDLATLVRKARIDFGAEINFLTADALDAALGADTAVRRAFGTLRQIGGDEPAAPHAVAALAAIRYHDDSFGTLVLMKPRLTGDGPADLIRYKGENINFPQQATLDQFFDEAQWESYYTLGRLLTRLVMAPDDGRWSPGHLTPLARATAAAAPDCPTSP